MASVIRVGEESDPAKRQRREWGESLAEFMAVKGMTRKQLVEMLGQVGCDVSVQAVGMWLRGETSPRPHHMAAIGAVFKVPPHRIFKIDQLPKAAGQ